MADFAPKVAEAEREEELDVVDRKAEELANQIRLSKHFIAFTGAGISTSAGVADFRGPEGVWTLRAQGREHAIRSANTLQVVPTLTHMALVELQNRGLLKYVVSQNCDGLHRKSGILPDRISELHGNSNREYCKDCGKEYIRDFDATAANWRDVHDHRTGRKCALCKGTLLDSIINFGENLPLKPLRLARSHAKKADLCLVLGSSLTVPPACEIPETVGLRKNASMAICNLQSTPFDELADLRVYARTDDLMTRVMNKLDLPVPSFALRRKLVVREIQNERDQMQLLVLGVDVDGTPASFLQSVKCLNNRRLVRAEPFVIGFRGDPDSEVRLELEFMGHYGEPNLTVTHDYKGEEGREMAYALEYRLDSSEWSITA